MGLENTYEMPALDVVAQFSGGEIDATRKDLREFHESFGGKVVSHLFNEALETNLSLLLSLSSAGTEQARLEAAKAAGRVEILLAALESQMGLKHQLDARLEEIKRKAAPRA